MTCSPVRYGLDRFHGASVGGCAPLVNTYLPDFNTADAVKLGEVELNAAGIPEAAAGVGLALALASAITRVMALAVVENLLPAWLRPAPNADDELLALDRKNGAVCDQARAAARLGNSRS